ncbi:DUF167 family protein [Methylocapsa polymorpha]|uniref:UPF0235 protein RZS28_13385 n=1 Tax=Methylocapsa polymorpha TaxID=3080828 RepID=A0ABZ0HNB3_9HYPH|nr:DUF167 family protein [Methylocapsa sp. RX1]
MTDVPWSVRGGDLILSVRLTPKSSRDEIGGVDRLADGKMVLKVRVRALPQDGEANEALIRLFAKALHIPLASVRIEAGASGRVKTLSLAGDPEALQAALSSLSQRS